MIYVSRSGQTYGPYSVEVARAYFQTGNIQPNDLVWSEDQGEWTNVRDHALFEGDQLPPPPKDPPLPPPHIKAVSAPSTVGGWLLVLCIILSIVTPVFIALGLMYVWLEIESYNKLRASIDAAAIDGPVIYYIFQILVGIATAIIGINLWRLKSYAVAHAKYFFVLMVFYPLVAICVVYCDHGFPTDVIEIKLRDYIVASIASSFAPQIAVSILWYQYLKRSKRVKLAFPSNESLDKSKGRR